MKLAIQLCGVVLSFLLAFGCTKKEEQISDVSEPSAADNAAAKAGTPGASSGSSTMNNDIPAPADVAAAPADAAKTASGLSSKVLTKGSGDDKPRAHDRVKVHYTGWTTDGKMFDSSVKRGRPAEFGLGQVIAGWTEGLQLMSKGEKRRIWIPQDLAYKGRPGRPAGMLVFDVELIDIERMPEPPTVPEDLKSPKGASKTKSGLQSKVIKKGTGKGHPSAENTVKVHYTGWRQEDGEMFDSSIARGEPAEFPLNQVIPGWTEGVQLMVEGETRRFWIPEALAYKGMRGPQGTLVFDVELLEIKK